jgi:hypothetical protein
MDSSDHFSPQLGFDSALGKTFFRYFFISLAVVGEFHVLFQQIYIYIYKEYTQKKKFSIYTPKPLKIKRGKQLGFSTMSGPAIGLLFYKVNDKI